jgi:adenosine deaminase
MDSNGLRKLPKVEFHRHLDGSVRFETILDLSKKNAINLGHASDEELRLRTKITSPMKDLATVLNTFWTTQKVMCNYEAIRRVAFENVEDCFFDGVKLAELRFAPVFMAHGKKLSHDEIFEGILDGIKAGVDKYNIHVGAIVILPRSLSLDENVKATDDTIRYARGNHPLRDYIVGFDLADLEDIIAPETYAPLVEKARNAGLGITIHSGENTSAQSVITSIETYHAQRIGHGIKVWGDETAMNLLKERDIPLEVCPTSNWLTNSVKSLESHPLPLLVKAGVPLSINSDDPHLMNIDLTNEYQVCHRLYGFTAADFQRINKNSVHHSFLNGDVKSDVLKKYFS